MIWLRLAWTWLRAHWRPVLASLGAAVAGVAGMLLLRRRSPSLPGVPQVAAARAMGQHEGRAELLEQQATDTGSLADRIEAEIKADESRTPVREAPLQEEDDDAEVGRILTRRGW